MYEQSRRQCRPSVKSSVVEETRLHAVNHQSDNVGLLSSSEVEETRESEGNHPPWTADIGILWSCEVEETEVPEEMALGCMCQMPGIELVGS